MDEWWTYTLADFLMFSARAYQRLFELYHRDLWPAQGLGLALGLWWAIELRAGRPARLRIALCLLAWAWLVVAVAFLHARYARINWAAEGFTWAFAMQAVVLSFVALRPRTWPQLAGGKAPVMVLLGLIFLYPLTGLVGERNWRQLECFAMTPDLTALGTLVIVGILPRWERRLCSIVPALWCVVALATYWTLHWVEFWWLLAALGAIGVTRWRPNTAARAKSDE